MTFPAAVGAEHPAVDGVSLQVGEAEVLGVVGETGSGKTVSMLAALGLLGLHRAEVSGSAMFQGQDLLSMNRSELRAVRGSQIAFVFQDPMTSLHPCYTIGWQITEQIRAHTDANRPAARERAAELLNAVGIRDAHRRLDAYPHEFSGGMRQRAMIAMALSCDPRLIIADEPTTALDVTVQAQILELIARLQSELHLSMLLITHNFGVVAGIADRVCVMRRGRVVEEAETTQLFSAPAHEYTRLLLAAVPRLDRRPAYLSGVEALRTPEASVGVDSGVPAIPEHDGHREALVQRSPRRSAGPLLEFVGVTKEFRGGPSWRGRRQPDVAALKDVSVQVEEGETLALVGESGSGKSTLARCALRLHDVTAGRIIYDGEDITTLGKRELRPLRREMQMVFQDPFASLNPRHRVGDIIAAPMRLHRMGKEREIRRRITQLLERVHLDPAFAGRFPKELSGGQRQRVSIARALAVEPRLLVADEAVAALDVSIQAGVLRLFRELQQDLGLTYVFIAHDLAVVRHFADRVAVMAAGEIVEAGPAQTIYEQPTHAVTKALLDAVPVPDPIVMRSRRPVVPALIPGIAPGTPVQG